MCIALAAIGSVITDGYGIETVKVTTGKISKLLIPKEDQQEVIILESWTVNWSTYQRNVSIYGKQVTYFKSFIKENDAKEFEKQLIESAKFVGCTVETRLYKN